MHPLFFGQNQTLFLPTKLANLALWYDANQETASDGSNVLPQDRSGNGRNGIQATTANRPVLKHGIANGKKIYRFNGTSTAFTLAASLSLSTYSLFIVCKQSANGFKVIAGAGGSSYLTTDTTNKIWKAQSTSGASSWSSIPTSSVWQNLGVVRAGTTVGGYVSGESMPLVSSDAASGGTQDFAAWGGFGGFIWGGDVAEIIIYSSALSAQDRRTVATYLDSKYNTRPQKLVICHGNSLTAGTGGQTDFPAQLRTLLGDDSYAVFNLGVGGKETPTMISEAPTIVDPNYSSRRPANIVIGWEITNHVGSTPASPAGTAEPHYSSIRDYGLARKAVGFRALIGTYIARTARDETQRLLINSTINSNFSSLGLEVLDFAAIPEFDAIGDVTNTTWYLDGTHLTTAGYAKIAALCQAQI